MESFLSKQVLKKDKINDLQKSAFRLHKVIDEYLSKDKKLNYGIFLSHKHSDIELVYGLINFFKNLSINVYIDWLDDDLPDVPDHNTATKIKEKIISSKKFLLLATEEAINSRWCNWELGLGDAEKYFKDIAIIPVTNSKNELWSGNEYLQLYSAVIFDEEKKEIYVKHNNSKQRFEEWLIN